MLITADDNTKMVTFRKNGEVIKEMPTSMGKPGAYTDNGIYIVADKHDHRDGLVDLWCSGPAPPTATALRSTSRHACPYSGIFPLGTWSVWAQGNTNTSYGCLPT